MLDESATQPTNGKPMLNETLTPGDSKKPTSAGA
jgi:hypothetical protein